MEDEIQEKLEKIYNNIILEVNYIKKDTFKISGSIKTNNKNGVIRKGFTFDFEYDRKLTLDFNVECITKTIDKYIIELFKCNSFDNWTECEKRGCKGCYFNKIKIYKTTINQDDLKVIFKEGI